MVAIVLISMQEVLLAFGWPFEVFWKALVYQVADR